MKPISLLLIGSILFFCAVYASESGGTDSSMIKTVCKGRKTDLETPLTLVAFTAGDIVDQGKSETRMLSKGLVRHRTSAYHPISPVEKLRSLQVSLGHAVVFVPEKRSGGEKVGGDD